MNFYRGTLKVRPAALVLEYLEHGINVGVGRGCRLPNLQQGSVGASHPGVEKRATMSTAYGGHSAGGLAQNQESFMAAFKDGSQIVADEAPANCGNCRAALSDQQKLNAKTGTMRQGRSKRNITVGLGKHCKLGDLFLNPHGASRHPSRMRLMQLRDKGHYTTFEQATLAGYDADTIQEGPYDGLLERIQTPVVGKHGERPGAFNITVYDSTDGDYID